MVPLSVAFSRGHLVAFAWAAGLAVLYCLFVFVFPTRGCSCEPGRKRGRCRRCKGTGRRYRPGAVAVHRFWWSVLGERLRERRRGEVATALDKATKNGDQS